VLKILIYYHYTKAKQTYLRTTARRQLVWAKAISSKTQAKVRASWFENKKQEALRRPTVLM